jgi:hypothetical protein
MAGPTTRPTSSLACVIAAYHPDDGAQFTVGKLAAAAFCRNPARSPEPLTLLDPISIKKIALSCASVVS